MSGPIRLGRHFSFTIFCICILEMTIYINICMTEEVAGYEKKTTEWFMEREKENLSLYTIPSAEEKHSEEEKQAIEAEKRENLLDSLIELFLSHGIQLFCLWKFRKVVLVKLKNHIPLTEMYYLCKYSLKKPVKISPGIGAYCLEMLSKVNGSFAAMIIALPDGLREPTCVFYLILRALTTIESDKSVSIEQRKEALANFHNHLTDKFWSTRTFGEGYNKELLGNFDRVTELYLQQNERYRDIIKDSTRRMGQGMSEFLDKELLTKQDYDLYCHYVAGMVGISLTAMYGCGSEAVDATKGIQRANNLGLFLQKTNLIYESCSALSSPSGRILLPKDILSKFVDNAQDLQDPRFSKEAASCLNELIIDAFNHLHSSLEYMFFIKDPAVFNFYAIPLVLAAATLAECFGKPEVFQHSTKIRKGLAARIFLEVRDFKSICSYMILFINSIEGKIKKDDPNADSLRDAITHLKEYINDMRWVDEMTPHKRS